MEDHELQRHLGKIMLILSWLMALGILTMFFSRYLSNQQNPNQDLVFIEDGQGQEVRLQRNRAGHYVANGSINGEPVTFILDTGATHIVIPGSIAERLRLRTGTPISVNTANGQIEVYMTRLANVNMGGIELNNVKANINPYMNTEEILLGMSFLKHLDFSQTGDQLIIRRY